jgi:hypothetical protein
VSTGYITDSLCSPCTLSICRGSQQTLVSLTQEKPDAQNLSSRIGRSTTSNGGATGRLLYTAPLPFIGDPKASLLSTSINGFRLDDATFPSTKSEAATNQVLGDYNQGARIDTRFSRLAFGKVPLDVSGERCRHPAAKPRFRQGVCTICLTSCVHLGHCCNPSQITD